MVSVRAVSMGLVGFVQLHGTKKLTDSGSSTHATASHSSKYKTSLCRDLAQRGGCPRGNSCNFAHTQDELERYRNKSRRLFTNKSNVKPSCYSPNSFDEESGEEMCQQVTSKQKQANSRTSSYGHSGVIPVAFPYPVGVPPMYPQVMGVPVQYQPQEYFRGNPPLGNTMSADNSENNPVATGQDNKPDCLTLRNQVVSLKCTPASLASKSLVALEKRKTEIIEQLEKTIGKNAVNSLASATTVGSSHSHPIAAAASGMTSDVVTPSDVVTRSDVVTPNKASQEYAATMKHQSVISQTYKPLVFEEDEYIPFDVPLVGRFGPISRSTKSLIPSVIPVQVSANIDDHTRSTPVMRHPVPATSRATTTAQSPDYTDPGTTFWTKSSNILTQGLNETRPLKFNEEKGLITVGHGILDPPQVKSSQLDPFGFRPSDPSPLVNFKDGRLFAESEAVRIDLQQLEQKIAELKLATRSEELTKELRLIDQGIQEKCKEMGITNCKNCNSHPGYSFDNYRSAETYISEMENEFITSDHVGW